jgi:hypothetical protein
MRPELKAGLLCGLAALLLALLGPTLAVLGGVALSILAGYLAVRWLTAAPSASPWRLGALAGLYACIPGLVVSLAALVSAPLLVGYGVRFAPTFWFFPTALGAWLSACALRAALAAALGALGGWLATCRSGGGDRWQS